MYDGYELVWQDNFEKNCIDSEKWNYEYGYVRNKELQFYTDSSENSYIENNQLVIKLDKKEDGKYYSACLHTCGKKEFLYGRLEMRAKLPKGQGVWPAFWMLGTDFKGDFEADFYKGDKPWPQCGEIDIMELIGGPYIAHRGGDRVIHAAIHYPNEKMVHSKRIELLDTDFNSDYHIIGIDWNEEYITWYCDGYIYNRQSIADIPEMHKPYYLLLNIALGGSWPGDPDDTTILPQFMYVDYVRYYRKKIDDKLFSV